MSLEVFWFVDNRKVLNVQDYKFKGISNGYPTFDVSLASVIQNQMVCYIAEVNAMNSRILAALFN